MPGARGEAFFVDTIDDVRNLYGDAELVEVDVEEVSGNLGRVTSRFDESAIDQESEPWVFEDGAWRNDEC